MPTLTEIANSYSTFNKFVLQKASVKTEIPVTSGGINKLKKANATKIIFSSDSYVVSEVNRIKSLPSSGQRGQATEDLFNYMVNKGMVDDIKLVDGKVGSNNGTDVLAINKTGTPQNPGQIYSIECKSIEQTSNSLSLNKPNLTTGLPGQGSQLWHKDLGERILSARPNDPIGNMLINNY